MFCDAGLGFPYAIPSRVSIAQAAIRDLLLGDQSVSLCTKRVDLEYVRIPPIMSRVDDDLEVVVQLLTDVPTQFGGNNPCGIGVNAGYSEIHFMLCVEDADFCSFSRSMSLVRLSLQKVCRRMSLTPPRIIESPIQFGSAINWARLSDSCHVLGLDLCVCGAWTDLRLRNSQRSGTAQKHQEEKAGSSMAVLGQCHLHRA